MEAIKILIVDDSLLFREVVARGLKSRLPVGTQVEKAGDPFAARDKILSFDPDVMVLDVEMPNMNGIEFLRRLIVQYNLPTVVSSSRPVYKSLAMEAGAFSFLEKPSTTLGSGSYLDGLAAEVKMAKEYGDLSADQVRQRKIESQMDMAQVEELVRQADACNKPKVDYAILEYGEENPHVRPTSKQIPVVEVKGKTSAKIDLIAIGASTGGTEALAKVLKELVPPLPPIVIVQHIPPMFSKLFADRLHNECHISVKEAQNGDKLEPNWAYVAPGDKQMKVKNFGGNMQLDVNHGPKVNGHCPSVDVLFDSVADQIGNNALGVILTGMGADGANGLLKMRQQGAATIGQDEASCVVYGMPRAAYEKGAVERQLPLSGIASMITTVAHGQGRR
ncbi:chemotaxis-specific protein-glutamate methyltransferase CheB [Anaerovibrio lipolyticus]|uniref:chemotaxis-specific protein-glutamate methyltransferase CheB n=1 Tax=Anaerovibrio lipolyticus TaxID=82374 RepID=UPI001F218CD4|nr:chemotaxis-specific protein-glutamate methyltransferase CheB [Anaerovibrio lipolyticus]MCF2601123.1 chemotaxis-specific protein-glutamate methyltransferase CheB [Anaerovibrio lipolyticus]